MTDPITIYHNPRCSKSRRTLALLQQRDVKPRVVEYLQTPLTAGELREMATRLGIPATDLVRRNEAIFQEIFPDGSMTDSQAIQAIIAHPRLMQRPIVVVGNQAAIGRPPEHVLTLLPPET